MGLTLTNQRASLELLKTQVANCRKCRLGNERIQAVFGIGSPKAELVFVGEAPGFQEDHRGEPFVGRAGELLNKMIEEVLELKRKDVYITNVVKCHPMTNPKDPEARGNDRPPAPEETKACSLWWEGEMEIIKPKVICLLGASALSAFRGEKTPIGAYQGKSFSDARFRDTEIFATYHPAAILRNANLMETYKKDFLQLKNTLP